ncbi:MAG: flagellar hook-associated protein FlgK [Candidatus Latescibacteria bacterium]|nr:flagellar hook-associated protein FlgK [Candidatus Latescibacterota bacterium]
MPSLGSALQIGRSALNAQQVGLNTVGNNIANVNTPGYARKNTVLAGDSTVNGGVGGGVRVAGLTRQRDQFLDSQFRFAGGQLGSLEVKNRLMGTIESIFTELAGGGSSETSAIFNQASGAALSGGFNRFFNGFQDLANDPGSTAARAQVREEARFITEQFHRMHDQLTDLRAEIDTEVKDTIRDVNRITEDIASLNERILSIKANPTDVAGNLDDERDRLIDELSSLIDARVREETDGTLTVSGAAGAGVLLVDAALSVPLVIRPVVRGDASVSDITLAATGLNLLVTKGKLSGLIDVRDNAILSYKESLDELAVHFVGQVNTVHGTGFGLDDSSGNFFFEPTLVNAREIRLSTEVAGDLNKIATSGPNATNPNISAGAGDGSVAQAIADLQHARTLGGGTQTIEEHYSQFIGQIGAEAGEVIADLNAQTLVMEQVSNRRENVRGVSINEEASDLILFQRAYQAAARIISVVDEMYQSVLNM